MEVVRIMSMTFLVLLLARLLVYAASVYSAKHTLYEQTVEDLHTELERLKTIRMQREKKRSMTCRG